MLKKLSLFAVSLIFVLSCSSQPAPKPKKKSFIQKTKEVVCFWCAKAEEASKED